MCLYIYHCFLQIYTWIFFIESKLYPLLETSLHSSAPSLKELYFNFYGTFETKNCVHLRLLVYCVFDFILFLLLFTIFLFLCYCCYNLPYSFYTRVDICSKYNLGWKYSFSQFHIYDVSILFSFPSYITYFCRGVLLNLLLDLKFEVMSIMLPLFCGWNTLFLLQQCTTDWIKVFPHYFHGFTLGVFFFLVKW